MSLSMSKALACVIARGGTSKGLIVQRVDLPRDARLRDALLCDLFGSPDRRQVDGLGGADTLTSKVAIVGPPSRPDADIDYLFGQVSIEEPKVDYGGTCGNMLSAVAAYAIDEGFAPACDPLTRVRVHAVNIARVITADVQTSGGRVVEEGDAAIAGVPGTGAPIMLDFADTIGCLTGRLLPTGRMRDRMEVEGVGVCEASVIDAGSSMVFVRGADFGVDPMSGPAEIDQDSALLAKLERVRRAFAAHAGIVGPDRRPSTNAPLICLADPPIRYSPYGGGAAIEGSEMHLRARAIFMGRLHKALGVSDAVPTAVAALLAGTVVHEVARLPWASTHVLIGHPSGIMRCDIVAGVKPGDFQAIRLVRTSRRLMTGLASLRAERARG